jgi:hypothetical protein
MSSAATIPPPAERPAAVTVIGWVWIVYGILKLVGGVWALAAWRFGGLRDVFAGPGFPTALPTRILQNAFGHLALGLAAQVVFAGSVVIAAAALLRLRSWARSAIEVLCWFSLCYVVAFTLGWIWLWRRVSVGAPRPDSFRFIGLTVAIGAAIVLGLAFISMIRALRGDDVRRAFRGGTA